MIELKTPISEEAAAALQVGDTVEISGYILCGRDAVLPKVLKMIEDGTVGDLGVDLHGQVIFHTKVHGAANACSASTLVRYFRQVDEVGQLILIGVSLLLKRIGTALGDLYIMETIELEGLS